MPSEVVENLRSRIETMSLVSSMFSCIDILSPLQLIAANFSYRSSFLRFGFFGIALHKICSIVVGFLFS